ncbi:MAG: hypothetical protein HPY59_13125 [Anaerolineae bacterium]|nr:hypothetical protein [Anaerolineae bacterium]
MAYLVDGHNLIPKLGIRLDDPDDERRLLERLQEFCRASRKKIEVFFDRAPAGFANTRRFGMVKAHFIRSGETADEAILARLRRLGRAAANWTVVSSDLRLQAEARALKALVMASEDFALQIKNVQTGEMAGKREEMMSDEDVQEWLNIFRERK